MARKNKNKNYPKPVKQMDTLGTLLKSAREELNFDVESIHSKTKIPVESILHIESELWDLLPSPVYVRGFIKLYAREVNLDYSEIISLYPGKSEPIERAKHNKTTALPALASFSEGEEKRKEESESRVSTALLVFILLILATLAISYFSSQKDNEAGQSPSAAEAANYDVTG
jgi:cytoskeleton protein RodZ